MLVNQTMAARYWPGEDPVGERIAKLANDAWIYGDEWLTIVGVVGDVRHRGLTADVQPALYVHAFQRPHWTRWATTAVRTSVPPEQLADPVRERMRSLDRNVPLELATMESRLSASLAERRFTFFVLGLFAAVTLVLAAVGIYGVAAYSVERRRREMGIRLALGARCTSVLGRVLGGSMSLVGIGVAAGIAGAFDLTRLLEGLHYKVDPLDPVVFLGVAMLLGLVR